VLSFFLLLPDCPPIAAPRAKPAQTFTDQKQWNHTRGTESLSTPPRVAMNAAPHPPRNRRTALCERINPIGLVFL